MTTRLNKQTRGGREIRGRKYMPNRELPLPPVIVCSVVNLFGVPADLPGPCRRVRVGYEGRDVNPGTE
jgi:hypothetical protein